MNSDTTIITNAANGTIITITKIHHDDHRRMIAAALAALSLICFSAGLYLLLRKEKPKRS
jgi:hypothetical protein